MASIVCLHEIGLRPLLAKNIVAVDELRLYRFPQKSYKQKKFASPDMGNDFPEAVIPNLTLEIFLGEVQLLMRSTVISTSKSCSII